MCVPKQETEKQKNGTLVEFEEEWNVLERTHPSEKQKIVKELLSDTILRSLRSRDR